MKDFIILLLIHSINIILIQQFQSWNQKYTGHLMKDDLSEEYLSKTPKEKLVYFCDAYDCILLRNPKFRII